jgi:hypothetical protein
LQNEIAEPQPKYRWRSVTAAVVAAAGSQPTDVDNPRNGV